MITNYSNSTYASTKKCSRKALCTSITYTRLGYKYLNVNTCYRDDIGSWCRTTILIFDSNLAYCVNLIFHKWVKPPMHLQVPISHFSTFWSPTKLGPSMLVTRDLGTQMACGLVCGEQITLVAQMSFLAFLSKLWSNERLDLGMLPMGQFLPICYPCCFYIACWFACCRFASHLMFCIVHPMCKDTLRQSVPLRCTWSTWCEECPPSCSTYFLSSKGNL